MQGLPGTATALVAKGKDEIKSSGGRAKPCSHLHAAISAWGLSWPRGKLSQNHSCYVCRAWSSRLNATERMRCELQHHNSRPEVLYCKTAQGRARIFIQCCNSPASFLSPATALWVEIHPKRIKSHPPQPCEMWAKLAGLGPLCLSLRLQ